ncbi:MAG: ABC transporter ATP-binding protein [Anaerococcus sp.]|uniref:ABC transporter ATP-binding protein n=1 Tax=Anaerococcus sp. TaxID=1872515 RepID=UPI0029089CDB|nr:ABC transporter ATP-binding protein [Anaerococcus sp.]MDU4026011.1 ABC transporter ATP-binding protein [Anaerococcus sp.]
MNVLKLDNIYKSFGEKDVLNGISFSVDKGEIIGLLGVSGSGKSTIFNIISGNLLPNQGKVFIKGEQTTGETGHVSYMLQKDLLFDHMKVIDNAALPLRIKGVSKNEARKEASSYFKEFGLENQDNKYPRELSGGMRQRVALLRTYLNKEPLILLDEPFSALDQLTKNKLHTWFLDIIKKYDMTGIFISHDIDEAIYLSDRILILKTDEKLHDQIVIKEKNRNEDFKLSEEFLAYKREIVNKLNEN